MVIDHYKETREYDTDKITNALVCVQNQKKRRNEAGKFWIKHNSPILCNAFVYGHRFVFEIYTRRRINKRRGFGQCPIFFRAPYFSAKKHDAFATIMETWLKIHITLGTTPGCVDFKFRRNTDHFKLGGITVKGESFVKGPFNYNVAAYRSSLDWPIFLK